MYEKGPRQFYDDTCVVPEKFDGMFLFIHIYLKLFMLLFLPDQGL